MDYRLFGAKPLTLSISAHCQQNPNEHTPVQLDQHKLFFVHETHLKISSGNDSHLFKPQYKSICGKLRPRNVLFPDA